MKKIIFLLLFYASTAFAQIDTIRVENSVRYDTVRNVITHVGRTLYDLVFDFSKAPDSVKKFCNLNARTLMLYVRTVDTDRYLYATFKLFNESNRSKIYRIPTEMRLEYIKNNAEIQILTPNRKYRLLFCDANGVQYFEYNLIIL